MPESAGLIACLDVAYGASAAAAACVLIDAWYASSPIEVMSILFPGPPADYEPGAFFRRELPLLTAVLKAVNMPIGVAVIDGYCWLGRDGEPGLGARLFEQFGGSIPVIGVAKTRYRGDTWSIEVFRANSKRPLLVTSAGIDANEAAGHIRRMHGQFRIPTMLKAADGAARQRLQLLEG